MLEEMTNIQLRIIILKTQLYSTFNMIRGVKEIWIIDV